MANRFPLIVNTTSGNSVQELPSGDFLDLSSSGIANSGNITVNTGSFFIGNGSQLTGLAASYGNANVVANLAALGSNPVSTTGNVTGGNLLTGGLISAAANVSAPYFIGNGAALTGLSASKIFNGTSEANIGASGGNANITIGGTSNVVVVATTGVLVTGIVSATGNVTGGNLSGTNIVGTLTTASQTNITSVGTLGSLAVTANVTGGNLLTAGLISATGNILAGNIIVIGGFYDTGDHLVTSTAANANIVLTPTGTGITQNNSAFSASGNVTGGNILTGGLISAASTVTGTSHLGAVVSVTGNVTAANVIINGTAAAGSGVLIVSGNIQTSTANATANIGNASNYFNRLFAQATTALYADLAEVYKADAQYPPGTVLVFGGTQEVTMSTESHDVKIAGVVSTHPAHVMNSGLQSEFTVEVGLIGRVPCRVIGPIAAGDRVVSSNRAGVAERLDMSKYQPGVIIGKALESYSSTEVGTIEVVVGRL